MLQPLLPYDEEALIRAMAAGDRLAFTQLYSCYLHGLQQYAYLFTGSMEVAEEVVQDVFLKVWEKRERLGELASFKAYLFRMAKNRLINHIRREQVRTRAFALLGQQAGYISNGEDTLHQVNFKHTNELLQTAIARLPNKRRQIFLMSTEEGLTLDEIALRMGISRNVVKKQLYNAYDNVRTYMVKHGELSVFFVLLAAFVKK